MDIDGQAGRLGHLPGPHRSLGTQTDGITFFIVDMHSSGLDIRPLRELTGASMFNEVFLDKVFVPDDCVIGAVNSGWAAARMTLANERISMSSGSTYGIGVESLSKLADRQTAMPSRPACWCGSGNSWPRRSRSG